MIIKLFELLDKSTFIPIFAFNISQFDGYLARRAGFGEQCIVLGRLDGGKCNYDGYSWGDRTFQVAHDYIEKNWNSLKSEDVIDVEYILGETEHKKQSERKTYF